jgi:hypothetical protein
MTKTPVDTTDTSYLLFPLADQSSVIPAQGEAVNSAGMPAGCGTVGACLRRCALQAGIQ